MKIPWSVGAGARAERLCVRLRVHVRLAVSRRTCSAGVCALNRERALIGGGGQVCASVKGWRHLSCVRGVRLGQGAEGVGGWLGCMKWR